MIHLTYVLDSQTTVPKAFFLIQQKVLGLMQKFSIQYDDTNEVKILIRNLHLSSSRIIYDIKVTSYVISFLFLFNGIYFSDSSYAYINIKLRELESNRTEKATSCSTKQNENNTADSHYLKKLANTHISTHIQNIANWKQRLRRHIDNIYFILKP